MEPKEKDTPAGVGPGITGASGDLIDETGHGSGVGGTGHGNEEDAAGMRPQERYTARDERGGDAEGARTTRPSGSDSGTVGGGGPHAVPSEAAGPGRAGGGGALGDVPGGVRNVSPANDRASDAEHVHEGQGQNRSKRTNHIRAGNPGTEDEH